MSHNRTWIIDTYGDGVYHGVYNTLSTAACASIAYGYFRHGRGQGPRLWLKPRSPGIQLAAFALQALGLAGIAQLAPRFQVPVTWKPGTTNATTAATEPASTPTAVVGPQLPATSTSSSAGSPSGSPSGSFAVRCPMDFRPRDMPADGVFGLTRITRHPALWCLSFLGLGAALVTPYAAPVACFTMPTLLALIGGAHQDYRFRRGQGGTLSPEVDAKTSNVPFLALVTGAGSWSGLQDELKMTNAVMAAIVAGLLAVRRRPTPALVRSLHHTTKAPPTPNVA